MVYKKRVVDERGSTDDDDDGASESESVWEWSEGATCVGCRPFVCGEEVTTCGTHGGDVTMG